MEEAASVFTTLIAIPLPSRPTLQSVAGAADCGCRREKANRAAGCDDAHGDADVNVAAARSGNGGAG